MTPEETRREGLAVLEQAAQLLAHYVSQVESLEALEGLNNYGRRCDAAGRFGAPRCEAWAAPE